VSSQPVVEGTPNSDEAILAENQPLKEFGRLSSTCANTSEDQSPGSMKSIGKMLVNAQVISNIISGGKERSRRLATAKIISDTQGSGICLLLEQIGVCPNVAGGVIVGHDGLVIACTLKDPSNKEVIGALSSSLHSHTCLTTKKLGLGQLQQTIMRSPNYLTILTKAEVGIMAILVDNPDSAELSTVLMSIETALKSKA
jgi:predicted regulator of Ras-like GTPase activity (Roadblock/LC7/MglB family)